MKKPFHLLVLEDDPSESKLLELLIRKHFPQWHYSFVSSAEALHAILGGRSPEFSLLLTDIHLPGQDGISLVHQIRQNPGYDPLPIIGFSSQATRANVNALLESGATAFFEKPLTIELLVKLLGKLPAFCVD